MQVSTGCVGDRGEPSEPVRVGGLCEDTWGLRGRKEAGTLGRRNSMSEGKEAGNALLTCAGHCQQ